MVERTSACAEVRRMVRLGHPARLLPAVLQHSLDVLVNRSEGARLADDIKSQFIEIWDKFYILS